MGLWIHCCRTASISEPEIGRHANCKRELVLHCRLPASVFFGVRSKTSDCKLAGVLNVEGPCVYIVQTLFLEALNFSPPCAKDVTTTSSMLFPSCADSANNKIPWENWTQDIQFHLADVSWPPVDRSKIDVAYKHTPVARQHKCQHWWLASMLLITPPL